MTMTYNHDTLEALSAVRPGHARFDTDGTIAIGSHPDGSEASLLLNDGQRTRHTWITGATASGKTELLRSLHAGAVDAGIDVTMTSALDTTATLEEAHRRDADMAERGLRKGDCDAPQRLLLVDAPELTSREAAELAELAKLGQWLNIAVVLATQDSSLLALGGGPDADLLRSNLAGGNLVYLRSTGNDIPQQFADGSHTAGVGYLNEEPFRAWWPGS